MVTPAYACVDTDLFNVPRILKLVCNVAACKMYINEQ